jgi:ATPase family protein associated with various cellular activities (AAA)
VGETNSYPASAVTWHLDADDQHGLPTAVFQSMVCAAGMKVVRRIDLDASDGQLQPDSIKGERILWSEYLEFRSLVVRDNEAGAIVMASQGYGSFDVSVAASDLAVTDKIVSDLRKAFPPSPIGTEPVLPLAFWHLAKSGPIMTNRKIEVASWSEVARNYSATTKSKLGSLIEEFKPSRHNGQLLLWHGEPGTGKTWAIRALAWAWKSWCRFEYVIDPDQLLERGDYLMEVLVKRTHHESPEVAPEFHDPSQPEKWRLLILEDSGELMSIDAKKTLGQGLSRLLNISDGILGQGTRTMILITTNEEIGKLNNALTRPGRCFSEIGFERFGVDEANLWLREGGCDRRVDGARNLSELYAIASGMNLEKSARQIGFRAV